jgi:cation diffusion facilitator family transporter
MAVAPTEISAGMKVTWVGMIANLVLVGVKISVGMAARSQSLVADGIHSLSDLFSDVIVLFGLKLGRAKPDDDHQFGHGRIETIASMMVGAILIVVGTGLAWDAVTSITGGQPATSPGAWAIVVAAASIILKEALYWYTIKIGRRLRSLVLIANAWHHRSDAFSSVAVLIGVVAAYVNPAWHIADACAALVVTFFVAKVGTRFLWNGVKELIDTAPNTKELNQLRSIAETEPGVDDVHDIRARYSGAQIFVEIHIVVDPEITVRSGHDIAERVRVRLLAEVTDVARVIVHVDPESDPGAE